MDTRGKNAAIGEHKLQYGGQVTHHISEMGKHAQHVLSKLNRRKNHS